jgi:coenzyme F420 hydrogenase subunit beta
MMSRANAQTMSEPACGPSRLIQEVFDKDRCSVCGACVNRCPYFSYHRGRVVVRDRCTLEEGQCYDFCPMAGARGSFDGELGPYKEVIIARSNLKDMRKRGQSGGVVSTLVHLALQEGMVDEAILTSGHPEKPPHGVRVTTRSQTAACAGSRYAQSGVVSVLNQALAEPGKSPLLMVGTPCQIKAAAAMRQASSESVTFNPKRIGLLIGLFCTWALDYRSLSKYIRYMLFGERAFGYDIPPPPADVFMVRTGDGLKAFPLEEIRKMRLNACQFCDDMTSTMADVSVGTVEGLDGWNTVIIRSSRGEKLVKKAEAGSLITVDQLPEDDLLHLKEAAAGKKERGLSAWADNGAA